MERSSGNRPILRGLPTDRAGSVAEVVNTVSRDYVRLLLHALPCAGLGSCARGSMSTPLWRITVALMHAVTAIEDHGSVTLVLSTTRKSVIGVVRVRPAVQHIGYQEVGRPPGHAPETLSNHGAGHSGCPRFVNKK